MEGRDEVTEHGARARDSDSRELVVVANRTPLRRTTVACLEWRPGRGQSWPIAVASRRGSRHGRRGPGRSRTVRSTARRSSGSNCVRRSSTGSTTASRTPRCGQPCTTTASGPRRSTTTGGAAIGRSTAEWPRRLPRSRRRRCAVWVHDYQFQLVPGVLRELRADVRVGFFLLPFPPPELFRRLPWRSLLLEGLLGANLIGFHTRTDVDNFLRTVDRHAGVRARRRCGVRRSADRGRRVPDLGRQPSHRRASGGVPRQTPRSVGCRRSNAPAG